MIETKQLIFMDFLSIPGVPQGRHGQLTAAEGEGQARKFTI